MNVETKIIPVYSESFKREVVKEFLEGKLSKIQLRRKYNIGGKSAILTWMRQFGYSGENHVPRRIKFESSLPDISMPTSEKSRDELQKEIRDLKRKLEDERLRSEAYLRIIQKAEVEFKIPIKKKPDTK
jgi:transposase-like protein